MSATENETPAEVTPLVVTSEVGTDILATADARAAKEQRGDTAYVILREDPDVRGWAVDPETIQARSAEAAVRAYAEDMNADQLDASGVTLVAVPARSWKPVRVKPKTVTTLEIEDA